MKAGDIALLLMQQPDGTRKNRPVLLLKQVKPFDDWIVCAISSQLHQQVKGFDLLILDTDPAFPATGLKQSSLVRLGMLSTVSKTSLPGTIGSVPSTLLQALKKTLAAHIAG